MRIDLRDELHQMLATLGALTPELHRNPDSPHDVRVLTRRIEARLSLGKLPARRAARISRQLRKLRDAAGDLRDLQVVAASLGVLDGELDPVEAVALEHLRARVATRTEKARRRARREARGERAHAIADMASSLPEDSLRRVSIDAQIPAWTEAVDQLDAALADPEQLHVARLRLKALRYAWEPFAAKLQFDLAPVRVRQDALGGVQDLQVLTDLVAKETLRLQQRERLVLASALARLLVRAGKALAAASIEVDRSPIRPFLEELLAAARAAPESDTAGEDDAERVGELAEAPEALATPGGDGADPVEETGEAAEGAEVEAAAGEAADVAPGDDAEAPGELPALDADPGAELQGPPDEAEGEAGQAEADSAAADILEGPGDLAETTSDTPSPDTGPTNITDEALPGLDTDEERS